MDDFIRCEQHLPDRGHGLVADDGSSGVRDYLVANATDLTGIDGRCGSTGWFDEIPSTTGVLDGSQEFQQLYFQAAPAPILGCLNPRAREFLPSGVLRSLEQVTRGDTGASGDVRGALLELRRLEERAASTLQRIWRHYRLNKTAGAGTVVTAGATSSTIAPSPPAQNEDKSGIHPAWANWKPIEGPQLLAARWRRSDSKTAKQSHIPVHADWVKSSPASEHWRAEATWRFASSSWEARWEMDPEQHTWCGSYGAWNPKKDSTEAKIRNERQPSSARASRRARSARASSTLRWVPKEQHASDDNACVVASAVDREQVSELLPAPSSSDTTRGEPIGKDSETPQPHFTSASRWEGGKGRASSRSRPKRTDDAKGQWHSSEAHQGGHGHETDWCWASSWEAASSSRASASWSRRSSSRGPRGRTLPTETCGVRLGDDAADCCPSLSSCFSTTASACFGSGISYYARGLPSACAALPIGGDEEADAIAQAKRAEAIAIAARWQ